MSRLFISDLHLMEARRDITEAFIEFLHSKAAHAEALYILGDFFEVWIGDDHDTSFNREIIEALANLSTEKYIMHGNRDFLLGEAFCKSVGASLLNDPTVLSLGGRPALLMHGDSMCTRDEPYMQARRMLRNPAVQADLLSKSIDDRLQIAEGARQQSKDHTRESAEDIMDVTPEEVVREMQDHRVDLMIHGHTHRPAVHDLEINGRAAQRIVLGDWDKQGWYLEASGANLELVSFEISAITK